MLGGEHGQRHDDDGIERTRNLVEHRHAAHGHRSAHDERDARHGSHQIAPRQRGAVLPVAHQLAHEVARRLERHHQGLAVAVVDGNALRVECHLLEAEHVAQLCGENRHGDARREADDDGIRDELDDRAEAEHAHQHEQHAGQQRGHRETRDAILRARHDAVNDDDERARRPAYLHTAAAEQRDDEAGHDGRDDALLGRHAAGDAEGDGKRQRHDTHDDAGQHILPQLLAAVVLKT